MNLEIEYSDGTKAVMQDVVSFKPIRDSAMNFSEAVNALKTGNKVRRLSWPEGDSIFISDGYVMNKYAKCETISHHAFTIEDFESDDWWPIL